MDITPSTRKSGAQRILCTTTLACEGFVALFAGLVAHGLAPDTRLASWILSLSLLAAMIVAARLLSSSQAWPYWLGLALQGPFILLGLFVPAMYVVGLLFALLYWLGVVKGRQLDREKDAIDRRVLGEDTEAR
ncbi:DUF4233 domain-containing protein [Dermabacter hominis]|uniref:DUF4233 domain-containing protein n=1 Tax=Dermabacter hominis TaxID=36740 RepID=UPI00318396B5